MFTFVVNTMVNGHRYVPIGQVQKRKKKNQERSWRIFNERWRGDKKANFLEKNVLVSFAEFFPSLGLPDHEYICACMVK